MDKQTAKVFPTLVNGFTLHSVKVNLDAIIENINSTKSHHAGEYGSFTLDQNLLENDIYSEIKKEIISCVSDYTKLLKHNVQEVKIVSSWANKLEKQEHIQPHSHSNSYVCGVIHLSDGGDLMLRRPDIADMFTLVSDYEKHDDMFFRVPAFAGQLVLFPSKLIHSVLSHNDNITRYSIAFNTWPTKYGVPTGMVDLTNK